jgi:NAD(P)H dehydrogenase (quinone)
MGLKLLQRLREHAFADDAPETLMPALQGVTRLALISGNAIGARVAQHGAVIAAAKTAGVGFLAYTSILKAGRSPMLLAAEHKATEAMLAASGLDYALLRNGWYIENYLMGAGAAVAHGVLLGSSGDGIISAAVLVEISGKPIVYQDMPQADYAAALEQVGLPGPFAAILADSDARAGEGALFDASGTLSQLIGRPTTPWRDTIAKALVA